MNSVDVDVYQLEITVTVEAFVISTEEHFVATGFTDRNVGYFVGADFSPYLGSAHVDFFETYNSHNSS